MNGVLAHEAKEIDIIKLASLVTREMMEIAKPRIAFIFNRHHLFKNQVCLLFFFLKRVCWNKRSYLCLLLASNFLFCQGRISLFAPLEMKILPVEAKNVVWKFL